MPIARGLVDLAAITFHSDNSNRDASSLFSKIPLANKIIDPKDSS
jgi:hypothetical protein